MTNKVADILTGIVSILVAAVFYLQGDGLAFESVVFPKVIETFLVLTGIFMIIRGVRDNTGEAKDKIDLDYRRGMLIVLATVLYLAAVNFIGFYVSSFVFLVLVSWFLGERGLTVKSLGISVIFALIMCGAVYGTFSMFLEVPTPVGILF